VDTERYDFLVKQIEENLYGALAALESGDLIGVRQQTARANTSCVAAWQTQRQSEQTEEVSE
jgi:hypothetical protein